MFHKHQRYLLSSFINNVCSSLDFTLGTYNMLSTIQLNPVIPSIISTYISKDVIGQIIGPLLSSRFTSTLDKYPYQYAYSSLFLQQICCGLECLTGYIPVHYFFPVIATTSIIKNTTFIVSSSINSKILFKINNGEDSIAKLYNTVSIVNSIGSSIGMGIGVYIGTHLTEPLFIFGVLTSTSIARFVVNWIMLKELDK